MRSLVVLIGAVLIAVGLFAAGAAVTAGASAHRAKHLSIPTGWKSYTYGDATISVPKGWTVEHNTNCPVTTASGALLLGYPKVLENCADFSPSLGLVALYRPSSTTEGTGAGAISVNGVQIYVLRASALYTVWSAPSLGIELTGEGPESNRILHTLR
jgi:hypothetical protein